MRRDILGDGYHLPVVKILEKGVGLMKILKTRLCAAPTGRGGGFPRKTPNSG